MAPLCRQLRQAKHYAVDFTRSPVHHLHPSSHASLSPVHTLFIFACSPMRYLHLSTYASLSPVHSCVTFIHSPMRHTHPFTHAFHSPIHPCIIFTHLRMRHLQVPLRWYSCHVFHLIPFCIFEESSVFINPCYNILFFCITVSIYFLRSVGKVPFTYCNVMDESICFTVQSCQIYIVFLIR